MDLSIIITGVVGLITTIGSSWTTWFFTRKKYDSEVDSTNIQNMQETLEFYKKLSDYNKERLDEYLRRNEQLEEQVNKLKEQVFNLMNSICVDLTCQIRKRDLNLFQEEKYGDKTSQEVQKQ